MLVLSTAVSGRAGPGPRAPGLALRAVPVLGMEGARALMAPAARDGGMVSEFEVSVAPEPEFAW
jgi:hypothetical protein